MGEVTFTIDLLTLGISQLIVGLICLGLLFALPFLSLLISIMTGGGTSRYPDGKCYLCRQGNALPGDTCPKCGTEQP